MLAHPFVASVGAVGSLELVTFPWIVPNWVKALPTSPPSKSTKATVRRRWFGSRETTPPQYRDRISSTMTMRISILKIDFSNNFRSCLSCRENKEGNLFFWDASLLVWPSAVWLKVCCSLADFRTGVRIDVVIGFLNLGWRGKIVYWARIFIGILHRHPACDRRRL